MNPFGPPDIHHLNAAEGWIGLGNHAEANEELEKIAPRLRGHPDVLAVCWEINRQAQNWVACLDVAEAEVERDPGRPDGWVHRSFTLHTLKRTGEAFDLLLPVAEKFPRVWTVPYNLACYSAQTGRLEDAGKWYKKALLIDEKAVQRAGIDDPDLKPLRDSVSMEI